MSDVRDEKKREIARHLLDRLIQDLATALLPILETENPFDIRIDGGKKRDINEPIQLSVTAHLNRR